MHTLIQCPRPKPERFDDAVSLCGRHPEIPFAQNGFPSRRGHPEIPVTQMQLLRPAVVPGLFGRGNRSSRMVIHMIRDSPMVTRAAQAVTRVVTQETCGRRPRPIQVMRDISRGTKVTGDGSPGPGCYRMRGTARVRCGGRSGTARGVNAASRKRYMQLGSRTANRKRYVRVGFGTASRKGGMRAGSGATVHAGRTGCSKSVPVAKRDGTVAASRKTTVHVQVESGTANRKRYLRAGSYAEIGNGACEPDPLRHPALLRRRDTGMG